MQKIEHRCSLAECTISFGADRSERSEDKNGTKFLGCANFIIVPKSKTTCKI